MSLCYEFQKWTMITFASIAICLTIGLATLAYGQTIYNHTGTETRSFKDCYSSMSKQIQYASVPLQLLPSQDDMNKPLMKTFITNACNFYHEKTGNWLSLGDRPDQQLAEQFYLKYKDTYPQSIRELMSYIRSENVGSPDCGLLNFAYCTDMGSLRQEYETKWNQYMEESKTCDSKTGASYAQCINDLMNKYGLFDKKYD